MLMCNVHCATTWYLNAPGFMCSANLCDASMNQASRAVCFYAEKHQKTPQSRH